MCGIFGFSRITDITKKLAPYLAYEMESRGRDSWGATDGSAIVKHLGAITYTWHREVSTFDTWTRGIFHTRAASTGAITLENQHPFHIEKDGRTILGIHNGIVSNHDALNKAHPTRNFDCDSPHIFMAIAGFSPTNQIQGYGNLAWYEMSAEYPEPMLYLARFNSDNLILARLKSGEIVFCSTRDPIERGVRMVGGAVDTWYNIKGDFLHSVHASRENPDKDEVYEVSSLPFGGRVIYNASACTSAPYQDYTDYRQRPFAHTGNTGTGNRSSRRSTFNNGVTIHNLGELDRAANICLTTQCENRVANSRRKELLCEACMRSILTELGTVEATTLHPGVIY